MIPNTPPCSPMLKLGGGVERLMRVRGYDLPTLQRFPKIYYNEESTRRTEDQSKNDLRPRNTKSKTILFERSQH